jgi:hypothetical protein
VCCVRVFEGICVNDIQKTVLFAVKLFMKFQYYSTSVTVNTTKTGQVPPVLEDC